jgi:hypothetical protein
MVPSSMDFASSDASDPEASPANPETAFFRALYHECSIPLGSAGLTDEQVVVARQTDVKRLTQQYADFLGTLCGCRGSLATKTILASSVGIAQGGGGKTGNGLSPGLLASTVCDNQGFQEVLSKSKKKKRQM